MISGRFRLLRRRPVLSQVRARQAQDRESVERVPQEELGSDARIDSLSQRISHLEHVVEGLLESVHRES
jgi:hypothetical protein